MSFASSQQRITSPTQRQPRKITAPAPESSFKPTPSTWQPPSSISSPMKPASNAPGSSKRNVLLSCHSRMTPVSSTSWVRHLISPLSIHSRSLPRHRRRRRRLLPPRLRLSLLSVHLLRSSLPLRRLACRVDILMIRIAWRVGCVFNIGAESLALIL